MAQRPAVGEDVTALLGDSIPPVGADVTHLMGDKELAPVTVGDLKANPQEAISRIGAILKKDVSDPKLWLGAAAAYFAPQVFEVVGPMIGRAASTAARIRFRPSAALDFKVNQPFSVLKEGIYLKPSTPEASAPGFSQYAPNTGGAPAVTPSMPAQTIEPLTMPSDEAGRALGGTVPQPSTPRPAGPWDANTGSAQPSSSAGQATARHLSVIMQELQEAAKRSHLALTSKEVGIGLDLMQQGQSSLDVVRRIAAARSAAVAR